MCIYIYVCVCVCANELLIFCLFQFDCGVYKHSQHSCVSKVTITQCGVWSLGQPHLHSLLAVRSSYVHSKHVISPLLPPLPPPISLPSPISPLPSLPHPPHSPMGFYFISCSHDRTARLWSTDHIQPLRIFAGHCSDVDVSYTLSLALSCPLL